MSIVAAQAVLSIRSGGLSVAERFVLLAYAVHARQPDDDEAPLEAWPTAPTVAAETGLTREHVQRCLNVLKDKGLLRQTGAKRGRANVYQVSLRRIGALKEQRSEITPTSDVRSLRLVMSDHTEREGEPEGEPEAPVVPAGDRFAEFWEVYPKRVAKVAAQRAWAKALKRATAAEIIAGAVAYRDDRNRTSQFTAHPATWLNGGRWDDEPIQKGRPTVSASGAGEPEDDHFRAGGNW